MSSIIFITHPEVVIDPAQPIPEWPLSEVGRGRMIRFSEMLADRPVTAVYASLERKAMDGAEIVADAFGLPFRTEANLGENDRESTGYIAPPEFWEVVAEFFAHPTRSVRGWERAIDAQARIVKAVTSIAASEPSQGDIVIVSHGGCRCASDRSPAGCDDRPGKPSVASGRRMFSHHRPASAGHQARLAGNRGRPAAIGACAGPSQVGRARSGDIQAAARLKP